MKITGKNRKLSSYSIGKNCPQKPISITKCTVYISQSHSLRAELQGYIQCRAQLYHFHQHRSCSAQASGGGNIWEVRWLRLQRCPHALSMLWAGDTLLLGTTCSHYPSGFHSDPWSPETLPISFGGLFMWRSIEVERTALQIPRTAWAEHQCSQGPMVPPAHSL